MAKRPETCPICGRPAPGEYRPFCTPRCQDVDLGRWLSGMYRVPGPEGELDDDPPAPPDTD